MPKKSATTQCFSVNKSPLLLQFLLLTHGLAGVAILITALLWFYKLIALIIVALSLFIYWRDYVQFKPQQIKFNDESGWCLAIASSDFQPIQVLPSTVITCWLVVLHFHCQNNKFHSLLILNDALNHKDYRALVVLLKIAGLNSDEKA